MPVEYLKRAAKTPETETNVARKVAAEMLADIECRGETAVREYAEKLDRWTGEIVVAPDEIERRTKDIDAPVKRDIEFATEQVRRFAEAQRLEMSSAPPKSVSRLFVQLVAIRHLTSGCAPWPIAGAATAPAARPTPAFFRNERRCIGLPSIK